MLLPVSEFAIGIAFDAAWGENGLYGTLGQNQVFRSQWFLHGFQVKNTFLMPFWNPDKTSYRAAIDITYFWQKAKSSKTLRSWSRNNVQWGNLKTNKSMRTLNNSLDAEEAWKYLLNSTLFRHFWKCWKSKLQKRWKVFIFDSMPEQCER